MEFSFDYVGEENKESLPVGMIVGEENKESFPVGMIVGKILITYGSFLQGKNQYIYKKNSALLKYWRLAFWQVIVRVKQYIVD